MSKRKQPEAPQLDWTAIDANPLQFLIAPESLDAFLTDVLEKQPKLYRAQPGRKQLFPELSSRMALEALLEEEEEEMEWGVDLNAARYRDGVRETLNGEEADAASVLGRYHNDGCTLQWHQPQRWLESLWRLIAAMERQLGCLVGANAYITPAGTQGLAPHYDDVDLWVCQTEGSKRWRLYGARPGFELPAASSADFSQAEIGQPLLDVTLEVGDVLFMPRGTVHQAAAQQAASTHVTISTHQRWALADFAGALLQELQSGQPAAAGAPATPALPPLLRPGLPIGFLYSAGYQQEAGSDQGVAKRVAAGLRQLADRLEAEPQLTALAADAMALDFMASRAPPHPDQLPERGPPPSISSRVRCAGKGLCRLLPCRASPEVMEAYDGETAFVKVISCLGNDVKHHMIRGRGHAHEHSHDGGCCDEGGVCMEGSEEGEGAAEGQPKGKAGAAKAAAKGEEELDSDDSDDSEEDSEDGEAGGVLVFPASYRDALAQLLGAEQPVAVKALRLRNKEEKVGLAYSLWDEGVICTVAEPEAQPKKKARAG